MLTGPRLEALGDQVQSPLMRRLVVVPQLSTYGLSAKDTVRRNESSVKGSFANSSLDAPIAVSTRASNRNWDSATTIPHA
jgi:hypothetical protein